MLYLKIWKIYICLLSESHSSLRRKPQVRWCPKSMNYEIFLFLNSKTSFAVARSPSLFKWVQLLRSTCCPPQILLPLPFSSVSPAPSRPRSISLRGPLGFSPAETLTAPRGSVQIPRSAAQIRSLSLLDRLTASADPWSSTRTYGSSATAAWSTLPTPRSLPHYPCPRFPRALGL